MKPTNPTPMVQPVDAQRDWFIVDATDKNLGRLATRIARVLRGKHKPQFAPHWDMGDYVVVINAEKVALTGNKENDKVYYRHSQRPGSLKEATAAEVRAKFPERLIEFAVKGMLPKGPLGRSMVRKLKIYAGAEHPHAAQQPKPFVEG